MRLTAMFSHPMPQESAARQPGAMALFFDHLLHPVPTTERKCGMFASAILNSDPQDCLLFAAWLEAENELVPLPSAPKSKPC